MAVWKWPATTITRVVDGDTVDAYVMRDLGFGGWATLPVRLRLNRIDAPRDSTVRGQQCAERVRAEVLGVLLDVDTVKTYKYGGPDDRVGEYMAEVTLPDGRNLSDLLVAEGLATYWDGVGPRPGG
jgi:endonuclease YncB( thermonuclease family)